MKPFIFVLFAFSLFVCTASAQACTSAKRPVILLPGVGGSIMETRFNISDPNALPNRFCPKEKDWYRIWIGNWDIRPNMGDCVNYLLTPDIINGTAYNKPGVEIRQPDFGGLYSIDVLGPTFPFSLFSKYFHGMIEGFKKAGYVEKQNLFGAPFDWRLLPNPELINKLKNLIETAFFANNSTKIVLVSHSLGGLVAQEFLRYMPSDWKNKFVHRWVSISTPFGGAVFGLQAVLSGTNFHLPIQYDKFHPLENQTPALYWLLPTVNNHKDFVVTTPTKNYTVADIPKLLEIQKINNRDVLYKNASALMKNPKFPGGVKFSCLISRGKKTIKTLGYPTEDNFMTKDSKIVYGDGDETVNIESLLYGCEEYKKQGAGDYKLYENIKHGDMISDSIVVNDVIGLACGQE